MALTGTLVAASATFTSGGVSLQYAVEINDDTLGFLGAKGHTVTDPAVTGSVLAYVAQMLPTIEAHVGVPVTLPQAAQPQPEPEPVP